MLAIYNHKVVFLALLILLSIGGSFGASSSGCGTNTTTDDGDNSTSDLTLTSSEAGDGFNPNGSIPKKFACPDTGGTDELPTLSWSNAPSTTKSFALTMIDITTEPDTIHMVLFDISKSATSVTDEDDFNDTNSAVNYSGTRSYAGPCPPTADAAHTYEFTLYALDVTTLVSETNADSTNANDTIAKIKEHDVDSDKISGTFKAEQ
ncbi:MAG: YbhB/YbcL family Raf kinase inhibitor-like protein [Deltaproteobacteria bacterium]|nr:YbhB/YbcL family Raf kinase inhibitor-like protein [Deltaproteobacteria bacterium]